MWLVYCTISIPLQDFEAIGIKKRGFQLKLIREARKLQGTTFEVKVPVSNLYASNKNCNNII